MDTHEFRRLTGKAIRDTREAQHLSQRKLADMAGTNQSYLWEVEHGKVSVGLDNLFRISEALDVRLNAIFAQAYIEYDARHQH